MISKNQRLNVLSQPSKVLLFAILTSIQFSTSEGFIWGIMRHGIPHFPALMIPLSSSLPSNNINSHTEQEDYGSKSPSLSLSSSLKSNGVEHPSLNFLSEETYTPGVYLKKSHPALGLMKSKRPPPPVIITRRKRTRVPFAIMNNGKQIQGALEIERPPMATLNLKRPKTTTYYNHQIYNPLNWIIPKKSTHHKNPQPVF